MRINGERIKQAREIRGFTQEHLANTVKVSQPHISLVEQGADRPSENLMQAIALATGFPLAFFAEPSGPDFPLGSLLYRKYRRIPSSSSAEVRQKARAALELVAYLETRFKPLPVKVPRAASDPAEAAQLARSSLGVSPDGPISGLLRKLEKSGVLVIYIPTQVEGFEAFSAWSDEEPRRPVICLKPTASGDRLRRTLGEELGHLILHRDFLGATKELEREADIFAGELLFPAVAMKEEVTPPLTLTRLAALKRRWGISMQAIAHYATKREIITSRQKHYIRSKMDRRGWLTQEPVEIQTEYPRLLGQMIDASFSSGRATQELSKRFSRVFIASLLEVNSAPLSPRCMVSIGNRNQASVLEFSPRTNS